MLTKKKKDVVIKNDGIELTGIVTDETKTKFGKDFYDYFYFLYNDNKINANKIVKVGEELSFGRNTKIIIQVENEVILEFLARPDQEYLNEMAKSALYHTFQYLKKIEKEKQYMIQY